MALTPDMDNQIAVHNIDDQGNITGQTGLSRVIANYGNINDMNSFSPELQAAIQGYQNPPPQNSALQGGPMRPGEIGSPGNWSFSSHPGTQGGPGINQGILNPINNQGSGQPVDGSGVGIGNMVMPQPGTPGYDLMNGPDYQYQGDSPFGDIFNDFYGSGGGSGPQTADSSYNPFTGTYGSSSERGDMYDFISGKYDNLQMQMQNKMVKSPEFMDKFKMYGDAMNTYNDYQNNQNQQNQPRLPGGISQQIIGPNGNPMQPITGNTTEQGGPALPGMPTPNNPTGTTGSNHSHNDLIQGIGNLLQQYMPNAAANAQQTLGQTTPTINNQPFPSMTNNNQGLFGTSVANSFSNNFNNATQPQQVFGNMITPMGRQG